MTRVESYVSFIEQHRATLKDVGGNSKSILAGLEDEARNLKPLIEKVDKAEREFLAIRSELKARVAALELSFTDQLDYARDYAKRHRLQLIRDGLRAFSRQRAHRKAAPTAEKKPAA